MKHADNQMKLYIPSLSINEGLARNAVATFIAQINPTIEEISDIKCAVSEAVTNSIVHGYKYMDGIVYISVKYFSDRTVVIEVKDNGCGIENIEEAMTPLFTTDTSGERSGMGFAVMQTFMDKLDVISKNGSGVRVVMTKKLS